MGFNTDDHRVSVRLVAYVEVHRVPVAQALEYIETVRGRVFENVAVSSPV